MHSTSGWYANIAGERHGPVPLSTLQSWAASGALNAETEIGKSSDGPWRSADAVPELELDWQVIDAEGNRYFPCNVLALRSEVEEGSVDPFWQVVNLSTGETYQVVDALCSALLIQTRLLEEKLSALRSADSNSSDPDVPASTLLRDRDIFEREALKWKRLYDDEVERNGIREMELQQQIEELRTWQRKGSERIKALERRRTQLEEIALQPRADTSTGGDPDLKNAYGELKVQMERLLESLELRTRQGDQVRDRSLELERLLKNERSENAALRESENAMQAETLHQLASLEQAHSDLTRSYRNLNDKLIRLRNQVSEPDHSGLHRQAMPVPAPAPAAGTPVQPPGRVKIKLT